MRQSFAVLPTLLITLLAFRPALADTKPNFIVVFCDDLGYAVI